MSASTRLVYDPGRHYEVVKTLGEGRCGIVSLAREHSTHQWVIIKKTPKQLDPDANERQALEALSALSAHHEDTEYRYLVTRAADSEADLQRLSDWKNKGVAEIPIVGENLKAAVLSLHRAGVAHRDLKPDNILIDPGTLQVKLVDFGLACVGRACEEKQEISGGTPLYMSPEAFSALCSNTKILNGPAQDLWSLGMILYELEHGRRHPFYGWKEKERKHGVTDAELFSEFAQFLSQFRAPTLLLAHDPAGRKI